MYNEIIGYGILILNHYFLAKVLAIFEIQNQL